MAFEHTAGNICALGCFCKEFSRTIDQSLAQAFCRPFAFRKVQSLEDDCQAMCRNTHTHTLECAQLLMKGFRI